MPSGPPLRTRRCEEQGEGQRARGVRGQEGATYLEVESGHEHARAATYFAEDFLVGHEAVLKDELARVGAPHPELVQLGAGREAGEAPLDAATVRGGQHWATQVRLKSWRAHMKVVTFCEGLASGSVRA